MHGHPFASSTQRRCQFGLAHAFGELGAQRGSPVRTLDGGNVEPFVGGDEVDRNLAIAYMLNSVIKDQWSSVSIPLFAMAFVVGLVGRLVLKLTGRQNYLDSSTINSVSGAATDYMIAFGIASITSTSRSIPPAISPSRTQPSACHQSS